MYFISRWRLCSDNGEEYFIGKAKARPVVFLDCLLFRAALTAEKLLLLLTRIKGRENNVTHLSLLDKYISLQKKWTFCGPYYLMYG